MFSKPQSSGYKFNAFKEIKSHSSVLYNERLAILWYILDMDSMALNSNQNKATMLKTKGTLYQIWKNVRCIIRSNCTDCTNCANCTCCNCCNCSNCNCCNCCNFVIVVSVLIVLIVLML
jgi:hypothetical protein